MFRRLTSLAACAICGLAGLCISPASSIASPIDLFGYGARGTAMGGLLLTQATGADAVYYNPALLAMDTERRFSIGYQNATFRLQLDTCTPTVAGDEISYACGSEDVGPDENEAGRFVQNAPAVSLGFGIPMPFGGFLEDRIGVGLAFVLPQTSILVANTPVPGDIDFTVVANRAQTVSLQAGVGLRLNDRLAVGWSMLILSALQGQIDIEPNAAGVLSSEAGDELIAEYSSVVGFYAEPVDGFRLGLAWHQESTAEYSLPINTDLGGGFPIPIPRLDIRGIAQFDPQQVSFELSIQPDHRFSIAAGATWKQWSRFQNPIEYSAVPDWYPEQPSPNFSDIWVLRLGGEGAINMVGDFQITPRAGIAFEPSPAPEQTGLHNYLDSNRVIGSAGIGFDWTDVHINLVGQLQHMASRSHDKDCGVVRVAGTDYVHPDPGAAVAYLDADGNIVDPDEAELVVPTLYPGSNPGCGGVASSGNIWFWGLELGFDL